MKRTNYLLLLTLAVFTLQCDVTYCSDTTPHGFKQAINSAQWKFAVTTHEFYEVVDTLRTGRDQPITMYFYPDSSGYSNPLGPSEMLV